MKVTTTGRFRSSRRRNDVQRSYSPSTPPSACFCSLSRRSPPLRRPRSAPFAEPSSIRSSRSCPGATVVITDESTSVTREVQTDAQGLFEIPNLRPGTYTVTATLSRVQESAADGCGAARRLRRAHRSEPRDRQPRRRRDGDGRRNQHHDREPGDRARPRRTAAARPAAQQPRHPGLPHAQPEHRRRVRQHPVSRRPHLWRVVHPGRPAVERRDLRRALQRRPGARRDSGSAGAVELVQRGVRRPCRRHRVHETRREPLSRDRVLRLQLERAERPHLRAGAEQRVAERPQRRHARLSIRDEFWRPGREKPDVLLRQLRRQQAEVARRRLAGDRADRGDAERRLLGEHVRRAGPADRRAVPGQPHPGRPNRSRGTPHPRLLLSRSRTRRTLPPAATAPTARSFRRSAIAIARTCEWITSCPAAIRSSPASAGSGAIPTRSRSRAPAATAAPA